MVLWRFEFRCNAFCSIPFIYLFHVITSRITSILFFTFYFYILYFSVELLLFSLFIQCKLEYQACLLGKQISVRCEGRCPCPSDMSTSTSRNVKRGKWWALIHSFIFVLAIEKFCSKCCHMYIVKFTFVHIPI